MRKRQFIIFLLAAAMLAALLPAVTLPAQAATYNVECLGSSIYANGTPLLITAGTGNNTTTIYIDANKNGVVDAGELTLAGAGIANAPEDNMSSTTATLKKVFGGAYEEDFSGDTYIVMTGGSIGMIFGGNVGDRFSDGTGNFSGTAYIKITGGYVNEKVYLGNENPATSATAPNSAKGTLIVSGNANIRWDIHGGNNPNNRGFSGVTTGFVLRTPSVSTYSVRTESFQHGILKTDATNYITVGTATAPADLPITIAAGETMTVKSGSNITIQGKFINNGTLIIESGATLTLTGTGNANNGTITNNGTFDCRNHTYTNNCDATCNVCDATRSVSHTWQNATCETPKTCSACGTSEGTALGHSYRYASGENMTETCANNCGHSATATMTLESVHTYTGEPITPAQVTYSDNWKGEKPAVVYTNNVNAGTATATLTVGGVTLSKSFTVQAKDLSSAVMSFTPEQAVYNGQNQIPAVVVTLDGKVLTANVDYVLTVNRSVIISSGTYKFTATGKGNYTGEKEQTFSVLKADFTGVTVETVGTYVYNGEQQVPVVAASALSATGQAVEFLYGTSRYGSYHAYIPNFTKAGTYTIYYLVRASDHNDYLGEFTFTIEQALVEMPTLSSKVYTGENLVADIPQSNLYRVTSNPGGTESGQYDVVLQLTDSTNYTWPSTDSASVTIPFTITAADNSWTCDPSIAGWTYGQSPNVPTADAKFGTVEVTYTGTANDGTTYNSTDAPTKAGSYTAIFRVAATGNYGGLEKSVDFTIAKANYDLSAARWVYTQPYVYDGLTKTVTVTGLPDGVTPVYTGNAAKAAGEYTAAVTFTCDSHNYNQPSMTALTWRISNDWNPTEYTASAPNGNGWLKENFVITPQEGYLVATHNTAEGSWETSLTYTGETNTGSVTIYLKNEADGTISLGKTLSYRLDKTAPSGRIEFAGSSDWDAFLDTITFDVFYKDEVSVAIDGTDGLSGVARVEYACADHALTLDEVKTITDWTAYNGSFGVAPQDGKQFVYFVRVTDNAGNVSYFSSNGAQYDLSVPSVAGVVNGGTYYVTRAITVQDTYLDSVQLNSSAVTPSFRINGDHDMTYVIVATDKAGNETTVTITMRPISTLAQPMDGLTPDNVKSAHLPVLDGVKSSVSNVDTTDAIDAEKQALQQISDLAEALEQVVAEYQAEISRIDAGVQSFDPAAVNSDDLAALEQLGTDLQALIGDENLTDAENAALVALAEDVAALQQDIADTKAEQDRLQNDVEDFDPATVNSDDLAALNDLSEDLQALLDGNNLTDDERAALTDLAEDVAAMEKTIADTQAENDRLQDAVTGCDPATVNSDDLAALEQLSADIQAQLENTNLTDAEKAALTQLAEDVAALQQVIADTQAENDRLQDAVTGCDPATVNSDNLAALEQLDADIQAQMDNTNLTDSEKAALADLAEDVAALQQVIADTQAENDRLQNDVKDFDPATVNSDDLSALDDLSEDLQALLDGTNLTDDERAALTQLAEDVAALQQVIADTQAENDRLQDAVTGCDPATVNSDDLSALEQLSADIQAQLENTNLTDAEKAALADLAEDVAALQQVIADTQAENDRLRDAAAGYDPATVNSNDLTALEQLGAEIQAQMKDTNLTDAEKAALADLAEDVAAMEKTIADTQAENKRLRNDVQDFDPAVVNSDDLADLKKLGKDIQTQMKDTNLTDAEKAALTQLAEDVAAMEKTIADTQAENDRLQDAVAGCDPATVNSDDLTDLEQLGAEIQAQMKDTNLTDAEKAALADLAEDVAAMEKTIADTQAENKRLRNDVQAFDPAVVNSDDLADLKKLGKDIQTQMKDTNLTDAEKAALAALAKDVAAMQKDITDAQAENDRLNNALQDYDPETVTSGQEEALETLLEEIQAQLESPHLTDEEAAQLTQDQAAAEALLAKIQTTGLQMQKLSEKINGYQKETVKSSDQETIEQLLQNIEALLATENITEEEAGPLAVTKAKAEELLDTIRAAADAANTEYVEKTGDITAENVAVENQTDLEAAKNDLEKVLAENAENYTQQEAQAIRDEIQRIQNALDSIEKVKSVEALIQALPQEIDRTHEQDVAAVQTALDALSDHEKSLVSAELKQILGDAAEIVSSSQQSFLTLIGSGIAVAAGALIAIPIFIKRKRR